MMKVIFLIVSLVLLSACQSSQVNLTHKLAEMSPPTSTNSMCQFNLTEFHNVASDETLGKVAATKVDLDVDKWAKMSLKRVDITPNDQTSRQMKVTLFKSYIHSVLTSMAANVVFKVEYRDNDQVDYQPAQYFRGKAVATNWSTGQGELFDTLNEAMDLAVAKISGRYRRLCLAGQ